MAGVFEHGAGFAAGAQGAAAGLQGHMAGVQALQELEERKAALRHQRLQSRILFDASQLEEQQRTADAEYDLLRAQGLGVPEDPADVPPADLGPQETDIPGVMAPSGGFSAEELQVLERMSPKARRAAIEEKKADMARLRSQAMIESLEGRVGMMAGGMGLYEMPEGLPQSPGMQAAVQQAQTALELAATGQITPKEASEIVSKASDYLLEEAFEIEDEILTGRVLRSALDQARTGNDGTGLGATAEEEHAEWVMRSYAKGEIPGRVARAFVKAGAEASDAILGFGLQQVQRAQAQQAPQGTMEGAGQLTVNRPGSAPAASAPGAAPASGVPRGTAEAPTEEAEGVSPLFRPGKVKAGEARVVSDLATALDSGNEQGFYDLLGQHAHNTAEREALARAAGSVSRQPKGAKRSAAAREELEQVRRQFRLAEAQGMTRDVRQIIEEGKAKKGQVKAPGLQGFVGGGAKGKPKGERKGLEG